MLPSRPTSRRLTNRLLGVALIIVAMGTVLAVFRAWQQKHVQSKSSNVENVLTDYEIALTSGDAKDAKKQIELLLERTDDPICFLASFALRIFKND